MKFKKHLALLMGATAITACGGGGGGGGGGSLPGFVQCSGSDCTVTGVITEDFTLDSTMNYVFDGTVQVGIGNEEVSANVSKATVDEVKAQGVTLTIPAGSDVRFGSSGYLIVTRGSKIDAQGTRSNPITFSSEDAGFDGTGEWGGIILQGFAPQYGSGNTGVCHDTTTVCNIDGEGGDDVGKYGGNDPADNSGIMRYVRIAEGGLVASANNEVNGLTLQGVGYGTTLEYIQVHGNRDDGVEWFGGTVNAKYLVLTENDDDDLDYDEGYKGNVQYALIVKKQEGSPIGGNDPRGIEANSSDNDYVPQTEATLANITIIGGSVNNDAASTGGKQPGMRLRGAVTTNIFNSVVEGFDVGCVRIDDAEVTGVGTVDSSVELTNVFGECLNGFYAKRAANAESNVGARSMSFNDAYAVIEDFAALGSAPTITATANGSGFVFDQTSYAGAVDPTISDAANAWWGEWTLPGTLGQEITETPDSSPAFVSCNGTNSECTVTDTIDQDYVFTAGTTWLLNGFVKVGTGNRLITSNADAQSIKDAGVTLTIRPGVEVKGNSDAVLLVTRGSKIVANGTATDPITFSSEDAGYDGLGEWGGLVIQGFAPQFGAGNSGACHVGADTYCNVDGEGGDDVGKYGGSDKADNSGVLRYVRIAEGGLVASANNEINGLTLQGVGHGTAIDFVQVHNNRDDGVEWFGGTVNASHLVLTGNDDDDVDFDEGYQGNIQFVLIRKNQGTDAAPIGGNDPRGIEANSSDDDYVPQTEAALSNVLVLGGPIVNRPKTGAAITSQEGPQPALRLRGAVTAALYNTAMNGYTSACIRIDDATVTGIGEVDTPISLTNVIGDDCGTFFSHEQPETSSGTVGAFDFSVDGAFALDATNGNVTSVNPVEVNNGSDFEFVNTDFIGVVAPGTSASEAWYAGWTLPGTLD